MARVLIVGDSAWRRAIIRLFLEENGHQVVLEADSFDKTLTMFARVKEIGVNLAIVDGSLSYQSPGRRGIAVGLKEAVPRIKIIRLPTFVVAFGYKNILKPVGKEELLSTIAKLGL